MSQAYQEGFILPDEGQLAFEASALRSLQVDLPLLVNFKQMSILLALLSDILHLLENLLFDRASVIAEELSHFQESGPSLSNFLVEEADPDDEVGELDQLHEFF